MSWSDDLARARYERDDFKKRATAKRKEWLQARKDRRWLDAIVIKDREQEYRRSAANRQAFIDQNSSRKDLAKSKVAREMAEAKSLRQEGNSERRTDLYSWPTPEQTIEAQAAATIARLTAERDAFRDQLRAVIVSAGGIAEPGVRDDFLMLAAEEVRLMKEKLTDERAALVEALRPFAEVARIALDGTDGVTSVSDGAAVRAVMNIGDLRRARALVRDGGGDA